VYMCEKNWPKLIVAQFDYTCCDEFRLVLLLLRLASGVFYMVLFAGRIVSGLKFFTLN